MVDFAVEKVDTVTLDAAEPDGLLAGHDLMSPYVWKENGEYCLLVRVLKNPLEPNDNTGEIYAGTCAEGVDFTMERTPVMAPGPDFVDAGGVEDPTLILTRDCEKMIFYTGVDGKREQGSLLLASGPSLNQLTKREVMLKAPEGEGNIKEATVAKGADGRYRLFYEYAKDNASRVGLALSDSLEGPWEFTDDPFPIRGESWDNWHLSTGPIVEQHGHGPVMFYNGATEDARWRIGWIAFDENYTRVVDRCIEPLIVPPPPEHRNGTDIAFAASCLVDGEDIVLYYSIEDRILRRAHIKRFD